MKKKKPWYDTKRFWSVAHPVLFRKERWQIAGHDVENIISLLHIKPHARVLDLCCGVGRHSLEFARRGYDVTGVDHNATYLKEARRRASEIGVSMRFIQKDMRNFLTKNEFDAAINLYTSFGYFENDKDNEAVLKNVYRSLKRGGVFLMELMGKEVLARTFRPRDWVRINGLLLLEERTLSKDWGMIDTRWILIRGNRKQSIKFRLRLYSGVELATLLTKVGFKKVTLYGDFAGSPYDHTAKRLVAVART